MVGQQPQLGRQGRRARREQARELAKEILQNNKGTRDTKHHDTSLFFTIIGLAATVVFALLQGNGVVTMRWTLSAIGYVVMTGLCLWSFSQWDIAASWNRLWRTLTAILIVTVLLGTGSIGVITESLLSG